MRFSEPAGFFSLRRRSTALVVRLWAWWGAVDAWRAGGAEVTPAYLAYKQNGDQDGYWIPNPRGGWMQTHPQNHNTYVNDANKKHSGAAKKLARQAKVWKYKHSVPISSCYLKMRAAKYADDQTSFFPVLDLYLFFNSLLGHNLASMNDPTGLGSRFNPPSSTRITRTPSRSCRALSDRPARPRNTSRTVSTPMPSRN